MKYFSIDVPKRANILFEESISRFLNIILSQTLGKLRCKFARLPFEPVLHKQKKIQIFTNTVN